MSLPKRVQEELQAAEALETQIAEQRAAGPQAVLAAADLVAPNEPPSEPPQPVKAPPAPSPAPAPASKTEDFEQKYRSLQGMYQGEVTNTKRAMQELADQVQRLTEQLAAKKQEQPEQPAVDPKDVEAFGAELMDMVQRYVERRSKEIEGRLAALESKVNGVTAETAQTREQAFYMLLDELVPEWKEINVDQRWLAWLGVRDDVYGVPRQAALDNAFQALDARRVAKVFNAFVKSLPVDPPAPALPADQQVPSSVASQAPAAAPPPKPFLREAAITAFYNDVAKGRYVGRDAEVAAIENEINLAVAENRVR